jgi:mannose-6-phosphate isomerase-like protein (cupin superfamily)
MPFIDNTNAPRFEIPGVSFASIAAPSRGTEENAVWRTTVSPNTLGLEHHMTREEIILAVTGQGVIHIGSDQYPLTPGDAFAVPAFTNFRLAGAGDAPFEAITVLPAGSHAVVAGKPSFQPPWSI